MPVKGPIEPKWGGGLCSLVNPGRSLSSKKIIRRKKWEKSSERASHEPE